MKSPPRGKPKTKGRPKTKGKSAGLVFAGAMALVLAGVVLLVAINNRTAPNGDGDDLPVDLSSMPPGLGDGAVDLAAQSQGRFQAVDRNDPNRIAWELIFASLQPLGGGMYRLEEPRAWFYFEDGQALHVRADTGTIKRPSATESQIESGTFSGDVVASAFAALPDGENRVRDPNRDEPWLLAVMDDASFDSVLLELSTQKPVLISTPALQFDAQSLMVRGNQVDNRLEYLSVSGPGLIRYALPDGASGDSSPAAPNEPRSDMASAPAPSRSVQENEEQGEVARAGEATTGNADTDPLVEADLYRAVFLDEVVVTQTGRKLSADALEVWTRLVDNKLPPGVTEPLASAAAVALPSVTRRASAAFTGERRSPDLRHGTAGGSKLVAWSEPAVGRRSLFQESSTDVVLSWRGTLTAAPLEAQPVELPDDNHMLARFTAVKSGGVRFRDAGTGGAGRATSVDYAVTSRELTLAGSDRLGRAWVFLPRTGLFLGDRVTAEAATGRVRFAGGGVMASESQRPAEDEFGPIPKQRVIEPEVLEALSRVEWAQTADLLFAVRDGSITSDLRRAEFVGSVNVHDGASKLNGEQLSVCFDRTLCGEMGDGEAGAVFVGPPPPSQGKPLPLVRAFGAGSFEHRFDATARGSDEPDTLTVTWSKSMFFEDPPGAPGHIRCDGDVVALATGPLAKDTLRSHRLHLYFEDADASLGASPDAIESSEGASTAGLIAGDRRLDRAEATGVAWEQEGGVNASIESRRYAPGASEGERALTQVIYLNGPRILADQTRGTLRVPDPGFAVVLDQRENVEPGSGGADAAPGARGTTRFKWQGEFMLLRASSQMRLSDRVEMEHVPEDDQPWARLTCKNLTAQLVSKSSAAANSSLREGRLESALAEGDVLIESADRKQVIAERAAFDVALNTVEASSEPPNAATLLDEASATPLRARRLRWNLSNDRVEVVEPAPISVPR